MLCAAPRVDIREPFTHWDEDYTDRSELSSGFTITDPNSEETLDFYLGFLLDDYNGYRNLSNTPDLTAYSQVRYFTKLPEIFHAEFLAFVPKSGVKIHINVSTSIIKYACFLHKNNLLMWSVREPIWMIVDFLQTSHHDTINSDLLSGLPVTWCQHLVQFAQKL